MVEKIGTNLIAGNLEGAKKLLETRPQKGVFTDCDQTLDAQARELASRMQYEEDRKNRQKAKMEKIQINIAMGDSLQKLKKCKEAISFYQKAVDIDDTQQSSRKKLEAAKKNCTIIKPPKTPIPSPKKELLLNKKFTANLMDCLLYTSPSPRDRTRSRMPSSA